MLPMKNTKGLSYSTIMNKVKELQELMITYNAFMAGQIKVDENFNIDENELSDLILKIADELGIDHEDLSDYATEQFGVAS